MMCPQCKSEMVKARATNFGPEYDYCRTCKKELCELEHSSWNAPVRVPLPPSNVESLDSNLGSECFGEPGFWIRSNQ